jgi:hypothetical protein
MALIQARLGRAQGESPPGRRRPRLLARRDPGPATENPSPWEKQIHIYDPSSGEVAKESLSELFEFIPSRVVQYRVFALDHENDRLLAEVAEAALKGGAPAVKTSV